MYRSGQFPLDEHKNAIKLIRVINTAVVHYSSAFVGSTFQTGKYRVELTKCYALRSARLSFGNQSAHSVSEPNGPRDYLALPFVALSFINFGLGTSEKCSDNV